MDRGLGLGSLGRAFAGEWRHPDPATSTAIRSAVQWSRAHRPGVPVARQHPTGPHHRGTGAAPRPAARVHSRSPGGSARASCASAKGTRGGLSSIGRALDCGSRGYGFEPRRPPHRPARSSGMERHPAALSGTEIAAAIAAVTVPITGRDDRTRVPTVEGIARPVNRDRPNSRSGASTRSDLLGSEQ
jgi:hypothetical protein